MKCFDLTCTVYQFVIHFIKPLALEQTSNCTIMAGESRVDLLNWLNATLNLNYTKVEQLGTGAAYCQIMDSIYLDVPMGKVKFDGTKEYEYLNNFKVLQSTFLKHKISKTIPVERLIKCKFQDNLEFFQWIRKFWKENKDESEYDPNTRRKYMPPAGSSATSSTRPSRSSSTAALTGTTRRSVSASSTNSTNGVLPRAGSRIGGASSKPTSRVSSYSNNNSMNVELQSELNTAKTKLAETENELLEYKTAVEALETERNFYFNKLREIEILTESTNDLLKEELAVEQHPSLKEILLKVQEILYTTEEGFQVPDDTEVQDLNMEEETF